MKCSREKCSEPSRIGARWDFEFLTTLKGTPWNPNQPMQFPLTWQFRCRLHQEV